MSKLFWGKKICVIFKQLGHMFNSKTRLILMEKQAFELLHLSVKLTRSN